MKLPPVLAEKVMPAASAARSERDRSFLIFSAVVLMAIALGFKSELLGPGQVWALALGMVVLAAPALLGYLRGTAEFPRIEHYIPVALGAITLAGLSLLVPELWKYLVLTVIFGTGFIIAARLDYLRLREAEKRGHLILQEGILILVLSGALRPTGASASTASRSHLDARSSSPSSWARSSPSWPGRSPRCRSTSTWPRAGSRRCC
ncbi:MAG: hypothetical protein E6J06_13195 [Chloroflexi bacterium]|nr:MAG: hypothetical protein E6J06_13195 [Chloroflexota bacterium]